MESNIKLDVKEFDSEDVNWTELSASGRLL
jgi:hypothetical protein